jgi:hypothetical protein
MGAGQWILRSPEKEKAATLGRIAASMKQARRGAGITERS